MKKLIPNSTRATILLEPDDEWPRRSHAQVSQEAPGLRDYWRVIRKHQWKIVACCAAAIITSAIIVFSMTPIYTAKASLLIERNDPQVVNIKQVLSESADANENSYYESQYEIMKSRSLAAEVVKAQRLDKHPEFTKESGGSASIFQILGWLKSFFSRPTPPVASSIGGVDSKLIDAYSSMLEIEPVKRSRVAKIAISASDPALAAQIANAHAEAYIRQGFKLRSEANEEARKFLQVKLDELKRRVEKSEDALNEFRRGKGIVSLDDKENIVVERLADLNKRLTEAETERITLEAQAHQIRRRQYESLPAVLNNPLIQSLQAMVVQLEAEHAKLAAQFLPGYPRLAQIKAQLDEAKGKLARQIKRTVEGIKSAHVAAVRKERSLRKEMNSQKSAALSLKDAAVTYSILEREASTNRQLHDSVLERLQEINVTAGIPPTNVSIIDKAEIPRVPSKPRKKVALMFGALLGLMGGLGLALVLEHLNNTFRSPDDIERFLGLPGLGVIPDFFSLKRDQHKHPAAIAPNPSRRINLYLPESPPVPAERRLFVITEAYRKLRTAIFLSRAESPPKSILFTSSTAGEGKTMTAANTAIMLAGSGNRVLLIDADMRRPACHKALGVQGSTGLSDYLAGQEPLEITIKPTAIPNLSVLSSGSIPPYPTELLGSRKMRETLDLFKGKYDFVLLDSPPVMPVSDAVVLSTMTDGVVLVVRAEKTPTTIVKNAVAQLGQHQSKILGAVLNRVDVNSPDYKNYYRCYGPEFYYSEASAT